MVKAKVKTTMRIIGAVALAKELGVTRAHLYKVVTGERQSRRLAAELKKRGIKCRKEVGVRSLEFRVKHKEGVEK